MENIKEYFENPTTPKHKQYEVLRGYIKGGYTIKELSDKFGYKRSTIYSLIRDLKAGKLELFPEQKPGPKGRRISEEVRKKIIELRMNKYTVSQIKKSLEKESVFISVKTVERILYDAGLAGMNRKNQKK